MNTDVVGGDGMNEYFLSRRMVLRSSAQEEKIPRLVDELRMTFVGEEHPAPERRQLSWEVLPGLFFQSLEDSRSGSTAVVLVGDDEARMAKYTALIEHYVDPLSEDELLAEVDRSTDPAGRAAAVLRAGLGAPIGFDARFFECITAAMFDETRDVRAAGLAASSYSFWPQYREPLAAMAEVDEDPQLRDQAGLALEAIADGSGVRVEGDEEDE